MEQALSGDLGWHAAMLLDEVRVDWFARAIAASVRPGDVVLDLGSGTGLLAMLAARAGAARVYAVEQSPIAALAQEIIDANGLAQQITLLPGLSFDLDLPQRAGVVVSETLGAWGADEGITAIMADAAARLARPDARLIPDGVTMWLAPLDAASPAPAPHLAALGLDFSPFFDRLGVVSGPSGEGGQATVAPGRLLAPAQPVLRLALGRDDPPRHTVTLDFPLPAGKAAGALVGWFSATAPGVAPLATGPSDPATMWGQVLIPLPAPIPGAVRVELDLTFERDGMGVDLQATPTND
jgi:SAM-dependent methyltransferase